MSKNIRARDNFVISYKLRMQTTSRLILIQRDEGQLQDSVAGMNDMKAWFL